MADRDRVVTPMERSDVLGSSASWIGEHLHKEVQQVISDIVRASKSPGELEKGALEFCTRIVVLEDVRKAAAREVKRQIKEDDRTYGAR